VVRLKHKAPNLKTAPIKLEKHLQSTVQKDSLFKTQIKFRQNRVSKKLTQQK